MSGYEGYVEAMEAKYDDHVEHVVSRLRYLADEIEREHRRYRDPVNPPDVERAAGYAASRIVHTVSWGVAHIDLEGLVRAATAVDVAPILIEQRSSDGD